MAWARENQALSGLAERPIRWLVDDALKFVHREVRRGARYDGFIIRPAEVRPGAERRGVEAGRIAAGAPRGVPHAVSDRPLLVVLTVYAIRASAVGLQLPARSCHYGTGRQMEVGRWAWPGGAQDRCYQARSTPDGANDESTNQRISE